MGTITLIAIGVAIGWLTKIPFLMKWYREYKRFKETMGRIQDHIEAEETKTDRGFAMINFKDKKGVICSVQKSSAADYDCIWLGANTLGVKEYLKDRHPYWLDRPEFDKDTLDHGYIGNNRMHLTQNQVKELIPILQNFVETSEVKK